MADQQLVQKPTETAVAAVFSLAPVLFFAQLKSNYKLDNLHIGLLQLVLLFVFRFIALTDPAALLSKAQGAITGGSSSGPSGSAGGAKKKVKGKGKPKGQLIDEVIRKFLTITHPDLVDKLEEGEVKGKDGKELKKLKLNEWKPVLEGKDTKVLEHPTIPRLFAISARFPELELKKVWDVLIAIDRRPKWDGLCDKAEQLEEILEQHGRRASVAYMTMKGVFPVKASDLTILSTIFRIPDSPSVLPGADPNKKVKQLIAATASINHPERPESRSYQRLNLFVSGFIVEEDPKGGCRATQITDLSGLPSWVPEGILKTVTKTLIPQSMGRVGKVARTFDAEKDDPNHPSPRGMKEPAECKRDGKPVTGDKPKGQEWMPPLVGSWRPKDGSKEQYEEGGIGEEGADEEGEEGIKVEAPRTYAEIISNLKGVTAQLSALEGKAKKKQGGGGEGVLQKALGAVDQTTLTAAGGAVGLATLTALAARWWTGRRQ